MDQGSATKQESAAPNRRDWNLPKRIAFRFAFLSRRSYVLVR